MGIISKIKEKVSGNSEQSIIKGRQSEFHSAKRLPERPAEYEKYKEVISKLTPEERDQERRYRIQEQKGMGEFHKGGRTPHPFEAKRAYSGEGVRVDRTPKVFKTTRDIDEYLASLPAKERYETESRLKGFKSGEERAKIIEQVNREMFRKADIEKAKANYGTPEEKYEELASGARGIFGKAKQAGQEIRTAGRQISVLEDRSELIKKLKSGFKEAGKTAVGTIGLALTPRHPSDIRNLEKARKELAKQEKEEKIKEYEEKRMLELEKIAVAGGHLTPKSQLALEKYKAKLRYGGKKIPRRGRTLEQKMGGGGVVGGFNLGGGFNMGGMGGRPVRPTQRVVSRQPQPQSTNPVNDTASSVLFGGMNMGNPVKRPIVRQHISVRPTEKVVKIPEKRVEKRIEYRPARTTNPVNDTSGNFLVNMGGMGSGNSPVSTKKKSVLSSNDPTGAGAFW